VIIGIGSDKGSPGATTFAVLLARCWPTERVVLELDPRGADLPYRLTRADGHPLTASPSVTTLAVDTRPGSIARALEVYAQPTAVGVPVITGETSAARFARIIPHLPAITSAVTAWAGTVVADLGSLQPWSPALPVAMSATVVLLVTRSDTADLAHLRDRVEELAADLGGPHRLRTPLAVVVRADRRETDESRARVERLLASIGSPVPVLGVVPHDPVGVSALHSGRLSNRILRSGLFAHGYEIVSQLRHIWPELSESTTGSLSIPAPAPHGFRVGR
jgi:hypothetical protein